MSKFEICTTACQSGLGGGGAGELGDPVGGVAVDGSGNVFVADEVRARVEEFSPAGAFIQAWGWGVLDGKSQLETCTTTCEAGLPGGAAGQLESPDGVAVDGSGDVFVSDGGGNARVDVFSSSGAFIEAWGWGVLDGKSQFETCTTVCRSGLAGGGAGALDGPGGIGVDGSGDVFVTNNQSARVDEFTTAGAFVRAWGWGVLDGKSQFETCTTTCETGFSGGGAGEVNSPVGIAADGLGDVFIADEGNDRVDEFSSAGAFIQAWGWGVLDGKSQFETCTGTCTVGLGGGGAGELNRPTGAAVDGSGDVFVADSDSQRVDEFSSAGAFIQAFGWGVLDGKSQFETCTSSCEVGAGGGGAGQLDGPFGAAVDGSGDVFVSDGVNRRVDEFGASPPQKTLTVSLAGPGSGTVTSGDGGIDCGGTCSKNYATGTMVTLTAAAAAGSTFAGWSGAGCSGTSSCTVTMGSDEAVTATFNTSPPPQYTLTVSLAGPGSGTVMSGDGGIDCGATCSKTYVTGTMVTLTAAAAAGSTFAGWSGAGCSGTGSCVVTVNSAETVTGTFSKVSTVKACIVPKVVGKTLGAAKRAIKAHNCRIGKIKHAFSTKVKKGHVVSQKPKPNRRLRPGAKVNLVVSKGK
jgi:hypothetical protein